MGLLGMTFSWKAVHVCLVLVCTKIPPVSPGEAQFAILTLFSTEGMSGYHYKTKCCLACEAAKTGPIYFDLKIKTHISGKFVLLES